MRINNAQSRTDRNGLSQVEIDEALNWTKTLFDLPYEDKMKAPHLPGPIPHRGENEPDVGKSVRKISDSKESHEIGSESDPVQQNIWLPRDVLPNFRSCMRDLYQKLCAISKMVLRAIAIELDLYSTTSATLMGLVPDRYCQLRLLHHPEINKETLRNEMIVRLPVNNDWGKTTRRANRYCPLLDFLGPKEGAFVINIGYILQRFSNDQFEISSRLLHSALHRVSVPDPDSVPLSGVPAQYYMPFFVYPDSSYVVSTHVKFTSEENPGKYEPVRFDQHGAVISKYQYEAQRTPDSSATQL
ncbi:oxidoreductase-like protein [Xylaria sp. FL1042]|nr:oxidoreductase-like protein [Xylaria sp. FL1042]